MNKMYFLVFLIMTIEASGQSAERSGDKLKNIDSGIVDFKSPESIINPLKFDSSDKKSISERMAFYKVPGVSIAIIEGDSIETLVYGYIKKGSEKLVSPETIFQAASTSKLLTSVIVLHYVEKGLLNLDEDVNVYLKRWKVPDNEFTNVNKVTLRLLLTHRSGLPSTNFPSNGNGTIPTLTDVVTGNESAGNKPAIPVSIPGSKWVYSNVGYALIQMIIEDITGESFAGVAEKVVFRPLKMNSSTFVYPLEEKLRAREALPHNKEGMTSDPMMHPSALAHGGLMTTPLDLAVFTTEIMKAFKGSSSRILSRDMAEMLLHKETDLDPALFGFPVGEGLGVMLLQKDDKTFFTLPGSNLPGTNCWLIGSLKTDQGAVVMTNGLMGELLGMEIITAISREFQW